MQAPASLLAAPAHQRPYPPGGKAGHANLKESVEKRLGSWFENACKRGFQGWQPDMAVRLSVVAAGEVPQAVREAAAQG